MFWPLYPPGLPQVSLVYLGIEMIQPGKSFLCLDRQGTPKEGWRIQRPKHCILTNNNKDVDNNPKITTNKTFLLSNNSITLLLYGVVFIMTTSPPLYEGVTIILLFLDKPLNAVVCILDKL